MMGRLITHYRIEACWFLLLIVLTLLVPKKAYADIGRTVMEIEGCDGDPWDCWVEQ